MGASAARWTSIRRPTHQFVLFRDVLVPDVRELVRGRLVGTTVSECVAVSLLDGEERAISEEELLALSRVPSDRWTAVSDAGVDPSVIESLLAKHLLLSDGADPPSRQRRRRDENLARQGWHPYAALYHFMGKWRNARQEESDAIDLEEYGARAQEALQLDLEAQEPPPHFHRLASPEARLELPAVERDDELYRLLVRRKTQRVLDRREQMPFAHLASLLYYVYGCQGISNIGNKLSVIKKTSPSGGSLHPIEVYPLLMRVEGMECGLYHYDVGAHALERIRSLPLARAESLADEFAAGQLFVRDAAALFLLTARFRRSFWKYREHSKAYRVVLMDAAHLSQTFYLVCTELELGAFFTTAINECRIEEELGIDDMEEGALAISGCGLIDRSPRRRPFSHGPYAFPAER